MDCILYTSYVHVSAQTFVAYALICTCIYADEPEFYSAHVLLSLCLKAIISGFYYCLQVYKVFVVIWDDLK